MKITNNKIKKIIGIILLLLISYTLYARNNQPIDTIHLATVNSNYRAALEKIAKNYKSLHPEIDVKISIVTNEYSAWLRTQFAGGEKIAPDIYNGNYTGDYVALGKWVPLNDYLYQKNPYTGERWIDGLNQKFVEHFYYGGIAYFIPIDFIDVAFVYNEDIFEQLNLKPPKTWTELINVCETIKQKGRTVTIRGKSGEDIIPMSMPGTAREFWEGPPGWFVRLLNDAYHRSEVEWVMARPGDWNFNPESDAIFNRNFKNPYSDNYTTINAERRLQLIRDGKLRVDSEKSRAVYKRILELSQYWPRGYQGINFGQAETLFLKQRAAILFTTSHFVTHALRVWRKLEPEDQFRWNAFAPPMIDDDPLCESALRGIGNAGANYVITKKSDLEHTKRVVDFMMFLTTPESGQILFDETIADDQFIVGPIQIKGVKLPKELEEGYKPFLNRGFEKLQFRSMTTEWEWVILTQELLGGRMDLDKYLKEFQKLWEASVEKEITRFNYDMDPSTRDDERINITAKRKKLWHPLENGILMVAILTVILIGMMILFSKRASGLKKSEAFLAYLLLLPTSMLLIIFLTFPAISGLYRAFTESKPDGSLMFVGLKNFARLLSDFFIYRGSVNMFLLTLANVIKATIFPFLTAQLIMAIPHQRLKHFFRTIFVVPVVVPAITLILIWGFIYAPDIGLLNSILEKLGFKGLYWLGDPVLALPSIIGVGFPWIGALGLLIYLAALSHIDLSIYDAAKIDCRNPLQRILFIDIPLVKNQTKLLIILTLIGSLQGFQLMLLMTDGGPGLATSVPALQMYQHAFKFNEFGYAAAIGFSLFLLIMVFTLLNLKFIKSDVDI